MRVLVLYDTVYGNTAEVARAIGGAIGSDAKVATIGEMDAEEASRFDILIVGSPTHGGSATPAMKSWLKTLPRDSLQGKQVAAFDTRSAANDLGWALRRLMALIGYAAPKIQRALERRGGRAIGPSAGFVVEGKEGPLKAGEVERAAEWAWALLVPAGAH